MGEGENKGRPSKPPRKCLNRLSGVVNPFLRMCEYNMELAKDEARTPKCIELCCSQDRPEGFWTDLYARNVLLSRRTSRHGLLNQPNIRIEAA